MDREQFREQITQRYIAGKALDGAKTEEIAAGLINPAEQMEYVARLAENKSGEDFGTPPSLTFVGWIVFLAIIAACALGFFLRML